MRQKGQSTSRARLVDQLLAIGSKAGKLNVVPKNEHVISRSRRGAVVYFFTSKQEEAPFACLRVAFDVVYQHVMIGHDQHVHAGF